MKTNIAHLPANKQSDLKQLVNLIVQHTDDIAMIILFGSYARGKYKEEKDLLFGRKSGHASDYDLLVITATKETAENSLLWQTVNQESIKQALTAVPRLIVHDIQQVNIKLAQGHYFYSEIIEDGCELYNTGEFTLAEKRELLAEEYQRISQGYFDSGFIDGAKKLYKGYLFYFSEQDYKQAAFVLNQATESAYKTILLVVTHFAPHEHYLSLLGDHAETECPTLTNVFPSSTPEERRRFQLLDYAYIGARYDPTFKITKEELEPLGKHVEKLLDITEAFCIKTIKNFN